MCSRHPASSWIFSGLLFLEGAYAQSLLDSDCEVVMVGKLWNVFFFKFVLSFGDVVCCLAALLS